MKRKKIYKLLLIPMLVALLASCEEVIEIDLNTTNPVLVAEGYIDRDSLCLLQLNYTTDYFHQEEALAETGARVSLVTPGGLSEDLVHEGDGIYRGQSLRGLEEGEYSLEVEVEGTVYSGISNLKPAPELLKLELEEFPFGNPHSTEEYPKILNLSFGRLEGQSNYMMLKLKLNGEALDEPFALTTDEYNVNTDTMSYTTFVYPPPVTGDTLELEFYAIDEDAFRYYYQVSEAITGMSMSSTPYNPASNMGEDILGYFMARTVRDTTLYFP